MPLILYKDLFVKRNTSNVILQLCYSANVSGDFMPEIAYHAAHYYFKISVIFYEKTGADLLVNPGFSISFWKANPLEFYTTASTKCFSVCGTFPLSATRRSSSSLSGMMSYSRIKAIIFSTTNQGHLFA